jgi:cytochrome c biogenesis protein ResB
MPHNPAETSLILFCFSVVTLYGPALFLALLVFLYFSRKKTRLERKLQKQQSMREAIAADGFHKRKRLAQKSQRRNIRELARVVKAQLEDNKLKITPYMHQRTSVFIEKTVASIDFERLYTLYALFLNTNEQHVSPAMETFFEQER